MIPLEEGSACPETRERRWTALDRGPEKMAPNLSFAQQPQFVLCQRSEAIRTAPTLRSPAEAPLSSM